MEYCTIPALKETVLLSSEYYFMASKQFLCSASWVTPSTCLDSFNSLRLALLLIML